MCPIHDFNDALEEFKKLSLEVLGSARRPHGNTKTFSNLAEFKEFHKETTWHERKKKYYHYVKKTDKQYKKTNIPSKINVNRKENPREWDKQYQWFRLHPDAEKYEPDPKLSGSRSKYEISKKIKVIRKENPKEWNKQYQWFIRHPDAEKYEPDQTRHGNNWPEEYKKKDPRITVTHREDPVEYNRQIRWIKDHPEAKEIPPRQRVYTRRT